MSITQGLSVIVVTGVLASAFDTGSSDSQTAFVGRWTMDTDMYVESVRAQQEKLAAGVIENYTKMLGSEEAARAQARKQQAQQLDRARQKALRFDLGADGTFTARSSWKSPRSPQDYEGRWIVWPKGVILFDTEVVPSTMKEPSPALGWVLAMESVSQATMRLHAGRLGLFYKDGLEFARADQSATGKIDVPVASPGADSDSGFVGTWRYDTKTVVEQLEAIQKRVGGQGKAGDGFIAAMTGSRLDLTLNADGSYVIEALLPEPEGEKKHTRQSGAWYRADDVVVCIGDLTVAVGPELPHRPAFVLRHASGGFEHVAGIMPLLNTQPPVPLHTVD